MHLAAVRGDRVTGYLLRRTGAMVAECACGWTGRAMVGASCGW